MPAALNTTTKTRGTELGFRSPRFIVCQEGPSIGKGGWKVRGEGTQPTEGNSVFTLQAVHFMYTRPAPAWRRALRSGSLEVFCSCRCTYEAKFAKLCFPILFWVGRKVAGMHHHPHILPVSRVALPLCIATLPGKGRRLSLHTYLPLASSTYLDWACVYVNVVTCQLTWVANVVSARIGPMNPASRWDVSRDSRVNE